MLFSNMRRHYSLARPIASSCVNIAIAMSVCMMLYSQLGINQFAALTLIFTWVRIGKLLVTLWAQAMAWAPSHFVLY